MAGTDADHWFKMSKDEKKEKFDSLGVNAPEITPIRKCVRKHMITGKQQTTMVCISMVSLKTKMVRNTTGKELMG